MKGEIKMEDFEVKYTAENGGRILVSPFADEKDLNKNIETAKIIVDKFGEEVKIRPHVHQQNHKNPEYEIEGRIGDRVKPKTKKIKRGISNAFDDKLKKEGQLGSFDDVALVIDISNYELTNGNLNDIVSQSWGKFKAYKKRLKFLYFVHEDKAVKLGNDLVNGTYKEYRKDVLKIKKK